MTNRVTMVGQVEYSPGWRSESQLFPVSILTASRYLAEVLRMMSSGRMGAGGCLFQPEASSQSRTNCLSKLGGLTPG